jgi:hypothetical protein
MYRLAPRGVIRLADDKHITRDMLEWEDYRAWSHAGNVPEPMPAPPAPAPPTTDEIIAQLTLVVQGYLDAGAQARNYDSVLSATTYAASMNPRFAAEGQATVAWRDAVWVACYAIMQAVLAGQRPVPTPAALISELPVIEWPA